MTLEDFRTATAEPSDLPAPLRALWHDATGDWDAAHLLIQDEDSPAAAWVHAYLHRKEGDIGNAGYWYSRARRQQFSGGLEEEWLQIAKELLKGLN